MPFPAGPRPGGLGRAGRTGAQAVVIHPWDECDADAGLNAAWDELLRVVETAWTWRDPETLSELDACLLRLGITVESDWS